MGGSGAFFHFGAGRPRRRRLGHPLRGRGGGSVGPPAFLGRRLGGEGFELDLAAFGGGEGEAGAVAFELGELAAADFGSEGDGGGVVAAVLDFASGLDEVDGLAVGEGYGDVEGFDGAAGG